MLATSSDPDGMNERDDSTTSAAPMSRVERGFLALALGALGGTGFAAFDAWRHAPHLATGDVIALLRFTVPIGAAGMLAVIGVLSLLRGVLRLPLLATRDWQRDTAVLSLAALLLSVVLIATQEYRDATGVLALLFGTVLGGTLASFAVRRLRSWQRSWQLCAWTVALQLGLAAGWLAWAGGSLAWYGAAVPPVVLVAFGAWKPLPLPRLRTALGLFASVALLALLPTHGGPAAPGPPRTGDDPRPDVVMVVLDTTRQDALGCYGGAPTPVLDGLAARGVVYEDVYSPAPWTVPSHASLFTGLYPATHGASFEHRLWLDDSFVTLAELLAERGYQTLALCSNHFLGTTNLMQGFDHVVSLQGAYEKLSVQGLAQLLGAPERWVDKGCDEAVESLGRFLAEDYDPALPLFLFVNLLEAHDPYLPPRREWSHDGESLGPSDMRAARATDLHVLHARRQEEPARAAQMQRLYLASVRYQDRRLGDLLARLGAVLDLDRSLTIVTADHGDNLGEHGRWAHLFALNDNLLRLPLVIQYPGLADAGRRQAGLCQSIDVLATVCDVLGIEAPEGPGSSLVPARFTPRPAVYAQVAPFYFNLSRLELKLGFQSGGRGLRASRHCIRDQEHKFIWSSDGHHELYDVRVDRDEGHNLLPAEAARAAPLAEPLERWWQSVERYRPPVDGEAGALDDETLERLRALGYAH